MTDRNWRKKKTKLIENVSELKKLLYWNFKILQFEQCYDIETNFLLGPAKFAKGCSHLTFLVNHLIERCIDQLPYFLRYRCCYFVPFLDLKLCPVILDGLHPHHLKVKTFPFGRFILWIYRLLLGCVLKKEAVGNIVLKVK